MKPSKLKLKCTEFGICLRSNLGLCFTYFSGFLLILRAYPGISLLSCQVSCVLFLLFFFNVYFWENEQVGKGQREGDRESEAGSVLTAESLMQGSNSWTVTYDLRRSWMLNWLSHPGAPRSVSWILTNFYRITYFLLLGLRKYNWAKCLLICT